MLTSSSAPYPYPDTSPLPPRRRQKENFEFPSTFQAPKPPVPLLPPNQSPTSSSSLLRSSGTTLLTLTLAIGLFPPTVPTDTCFLTRTPCALVRLDSRRNKRSLTRCPTRRARFAAVAALLPAGTLDGGLPALTLTACLLIGTGVEGEYVDSCAVRRRVRLMIFLRAAWK